MEYGLIGLGAMGRGIAGRLLAAGHSVKCWTRSGNVMPGIDAVTTPAEVFQSDAVLTMLSDDAAIREVVFASDFFSQCRPGVIHVVSSTLSVAMSQQLTDYHRQAGIGFIAAPVLGRPDVAARGELNILAAGDPELMVRAQPLFQAIGRKVWSLGDHPPAAHAAKIACNMMIAMSIEAMAEAVAITDLNGVPRSDFFELILGTLFGGRSYQVYSQLIAEGEYQPGFKATLGLKDLNLATEAAAPLAAPLPMLTAVHQQMSGAIAEGDGERDWSIMADYTLRTRQPKKPE